MENVLALAGAFFFDGKRNVKGDAACGSDGECKIFKESPPGGRLFWLSRPKKEAKKCGFAL
ncbi:MAG: hypothetical protein JEY79_01845 [Pseudodesulfovibrio sp.]|nr:hypothetical protein [Pseudodesulfovibrio sp.]